MNTEEKCLVGLGTIAKQAFNPPISVSTLRKVIKQYDIKGIENNKTFTIYPSSLKKQLINNNAYKGPKIYFIQAEDREIKIGITSDIESRLSDIQHNCPLKLRLIGFIEEADVKTEQKIHKKFRKYRVRGEWFEPNKKLLEYIEKCMKKKPSMDGQK